MCTDAALQLVCGPAERSFLEKLGAVDEELACGPTYTYDQVPATLLSSATCCEDNGTTSVFWSVY